MSFDSAVPINRVAQWEQSGSEYGSDRNSMQGEYGSRKGAKQRVNISHDTLVRMARSKLSSMVSQKLAYTRSGAIGNSEQTVGQLLSTKA